MNIKIHRGLEQIGGCITEIWTDKSRVFIDFGQNLPGNANPSTPEQDKVLVKSILQNNIKCYQAVFYTHAHEDHVGLFYYIPDDIPQYIGEGAKEILLAKYQYIIEGEKLSGEDTMLSLSRKMKLSNFRTWKKGDLTPIIIGDIKITPYFSCHSIYDSYMFLIEADGKRIWHTGDYRKHGYLGKRLYEFLRIYAKDIDVLITEGTMLNQQIECRHENEISLKMSNVMRAFKYVFVLASATDIERLASIKNAVFRAKKNMYINSGFMKATMKIFTEREAEKSNGLFSFYPKFLSDRTNWNMLINQGFVLVTNVSKLNVIKEILNKLPSLETLFIYSVWDGYYNDPQQINENPIYKEFREAFHNVVDIHTSGHADRKTIEKVIKIIKPKEVILIHKEAGAKL